MNEPDLKDLPPDDPIDLLVRPVFTIAMGDARSVVSLAGLLARLGRGGDTELVYLMPHQQHVMHAFVVQLMALVCARSGDARVERTEEEWRDAVRMLAGGPEAFQLVVKDLSKPAFMQSPVPEGTTASFNTVETPDALDFLQTAKNHDVKATRIRTPRAEHWLFALISLQTQQGYSGRNSWGVVRMNKGNGNRPGLGVNASLAWSPRVRRDVSVALEQREQLLAEGRFDPAGTALVWIEPWDGKSSIAMPTLDPFFIEACRRVRFARIASGLEVTSVSTQSPRIAGNETKGDTGDIWTPLKVEDRAALTLPGSGFTYGLLSKLLFGEDWIRPPSVAVRAEDGDAPLAIARAFVRGQGVTEGYHERVVVIPTKSRSLFASPTGRARLGNLAKQRMEAVRNLRLKVLKPALCAFVQGGTTDLRLDDERVDSHLDAVDRDVDAEFFPRLFEDVHLDADEQVVVFEKWLLELGKKALEVGIRSLPTSSARRERATASAEGRFWGGAKKNFPRAFERAPTVEKTA